MAEFIFNLDNVVMPTQAMPKTRQSCHDLDGALAYVQDRLKEMKKLGKYPWIKESANGDTVSVKLHAMPLYWRIDDVEGAELISIKNPDMTEREKRPAIVGGTVYKVANKEEGIKLLELLASGESAVLNDILERAAIALKQVDEIELPHTSQRAEILYNEAGHAATLGPFGEADETNPETGRMKVSKAKTNRMNQYKQTGKRQLGYERLKKPGKRA